MALANRVGARRPRIMTRGLALVFAATFGGLASFYLLLSVVPLYATSLGAGRVGAGLATGTLMATTVAAELAMPRLVARFGYRLVLAAGLVLLGGPALALPAARGMGAILAIAAVRGLGFAIVVVVGGALAGLLLPAARRGEGLGLYGVVAGVPSVLALPAGVWLARQVGYPPVFVAAAVAALAMLPTAAGLPGRGRSGRTQDPAAAGPAGAAGVPGRAQDPAARPRERAVGVLAGLRRPALARPALVLATTAMAASAIATFLPLAVGAAAGGLAAAALLIQALAATGTRWWAGRHADADRERGGTGLLVPGVVVAAAGMLALIWTVSPAAVVAGALLFGAGFGILQNTTLTLMFGRAEPSQYGTVSAVWNLAYDAGLGLGAAGVGVVAARAGFAAGFGLTAALVLATLVPAWLDRRPVRAGW